MLVFTLTITAVGGFPSPFPHIHVQWSITECRKWQHVFPMSESTHTSDEETLTDTSEVDVDAEHHEEEKELQVVVWTA